MTHTQSQGNEFVNKLFIFTDNYTVRSTGPSPVSQTHAYRLGPLPPDLLHAPLDLDTEPQRPDPAYERYIKDPNLYNIRCNYEFPWQTPQPQAQAEQVPQAARRAAQPVSQPAA